MRIYQVYVSSSNLKIDNTFSYYSESLIPKHARVFVVFNNRNTLAFVDDFYEVADLAKEEDKLGFKLSPIVEQIDDEPIVSDEIYALAKWLSKITVSPFIGCLNTCLPGYIKTTKKYKAPQKLEYVRKLIKDSEGLSKRQKEVYDSFRDTMLYSTFRNTYKTVGTNLIKAGYFERYQVEKSYQETRIESEQFKTLTPDQQKAYDYIVNSDKLVNLLYGVTGSGKTEVYLHLTRHYLSLGSQVLILVPEIALTPQMIERVQSRFEGVSFYHSELSEQEKYEQYKRVKDGKINIVVGTRSSIFLPFTHLGLIIIDEEHDHSYAQENSPTYKVRDIAVQRAMTHKAKVLLASATPSLGSYARALNGEYGFVSLKKRINDSFPSITLIDTSKDLKKNHYQILSAYLKQRIEEELSNGNQIIILLNRRGYQPIVKCQECNEVLKCEHCDISLTYHKDENVLVCHNCGSVYPRTYRCKKCGSSNFVYYGYGTKKIEEELKELYPGARVERFDRDSTASKNGHKKILDRFGAGEIDILVGTQMIAKGLDYPKVALVGILNADAGLNRSDYLAAEDTFDLLMQGSGRSGRSDIKGEVIVQVFNKEHYVLDALLNQDYQMFFDKEMVFRKRLGYPPFSHILSINLKDSSEKRLSDSLSIINGLLAQSDIKHLNPVKLFKSNDLYRYRIFMIDRSYRRLIEQAGSIVNEYLSNKNVSDILINVDPRVINE